MGKKGVLQIQRPPYFGGWGDLPLHYDLQKLILPIISIASF